MNKALAVPMIGLAFVAAGCSNRSPEYSATVNSGVSDAPIVPVDTVGCFDQVDNYRLLDGDTLGVSLQDGKLITRQTLVTFTGGEIKVDLIDDPEVDPSLSGVSSFTIRAGVLSWMIEAPGNENASLTLEEGDNSVDISAKLHASGLADLSVEWFCDVK